MLFYAGRLSEGAYIVSDGSAAFAEIETTDVAPAAEPVSTPVIDTTVAPVASPDTVAANEDSFGKEALADDTVPLDLYNDGGSGELTADQKATKALKEWSVPGEWNIGGNGGGPLSKQDAGERANKKQEEFLEQILEFARESHAKQERELEHARKWDAEMHEIAGVRATGREHQEMAEYLKSTAGKKRVIEQLMAEGMSRERAERAVKRTEEMNELTDKIRRGIATDEEKRRHQEMQREEDVRRTSTVTRDQVQADRDFARDKSQSVSSKEVKDDFASVKQQIQQQAGGQESSTKPKSLESGVGVDNGYAYFKTVNAGCDFKTAASCTVPEDVQLKATTYRPEVKVASAKVSAAINDM